MRKEACITLAALADLGLPPSRLHKPTGTVRDVAALERDRVVIEALLPLLDDHMAAVRTAAQVCVCVCVCVCVRACARARMYIYKHTRTHTHTCICCDRWCAATARRLMAAVSRW